MKKLVSLFLILTLLLGLMVGCGGTDAASDAGSTAAAPASEESAPDEAPAQEEADEPVSTVEEPASEEAEAAPTGMTIEENEAMFPLDENISYTIYYPFAPPLIMMGYEDPAELVFFKNLEEMTNVTLDFTTVSVEVLSDQFNLVVAGGDYPDIFSQCMDQYTGGGGAAIEDGVIIDLAPYIDEYAPHYRTMMEEDPEFKKFNFTDDGKMFQFMSYYKDSYVNQGYFVNTQWLEEQKLDVPVTYDDWFEVLCAFDSAYDMELPSKGVPTCGYYGIGKNNFVIRDGQAVYIPADDTIQKEYLAQCEKWFNAGLYTSDSMISGYYTDSDLRGMVTSGDLMLSTCDVDQYKVYQEEVAISAVPLPVLKEGDTAYQVVNQERVGNGNTITTACENVETLVAYMDYWYSDAVVQLANWGVEGETYTVNDDGTYSYTEEVLSFAGGLNLATSVYCAGWEPTIMDFRRKDAAYNEDQLNALEVWNEFDQSTNFPSFTSFTEEENEVIRTTFADIDTYVEEHYTKFQTCDLSYENDFQGFVDTLYDMGLQDVIDVYQAAYDRYMAR